MPATIERLLELIARRFSIQRSAIQPNQDIFEALGIDSVQVLELLSELEIAFDVEIPDYELREVKTFAQLAEQIDKRL